MYEEEKDEVLGEVDALTINKKNRFNDAFRNEDEEEDLSATLPVDDDVFIEDEESSGFQAEKDIDSESMSGEIN